MTISKLEKLAADYATAKAAREAWDRTIQETRAMLRRGEETLAEAAENERKALKALLDHAAKTARPAVELAEAAPDE